MGRLKFISALQGALMRPVWPGFIPLAGLKFWGRQEKRLFLTKNGISRTRVRKKNEN